MVSLLFCFALWTNLACEAREGSHSPRRAVELARKAQGSESSHGVRIPFRADDERRHQGVPSIKQVLISLRDPNGIAVRPSGFDCVRPCHSERSGAESNCEAAPSKAKVESRADSAQDDTQGATPSEKITKGVRTVLFVLLFTRLVLQG